MPKKKFHGERNLIGHKIREARLRQRPTVSQEDLAARLELRNILIDRSAISRMEKQNRYIRDYEIIAIADALKTPVEWFFEVK